MELLVIVLNKPEYLEKTLTSLVELGIIGATIFESEGMGHYLAYEVPIFAGLRQFIENGKHYSKTIFAIIENKKIVDELLRLLQEEEIDFTHEGTGILFTVPVGTAIKPEKET